MFQYPERSVDMDAYLHTGPVFPDQADRLALGPLELGVSDMPQKGWFIKLFQYVKPIYNCLTCQILYKDNRNTDYSDTASWNKGTMTEKNVIACLPFTFSPNETTVFYLSNPDYEVSPLLSLPSSFIPSHRSKTATFRSV